MSIFDKALKNIEQVASNIPKWGIEALKKNEDKIIQRFTSFQLSKGLDGTGNEVGRYDPSTEAYAQRDGISTPKTPGSPYNFQWTGETMENLYLTQFSEDSGEYSIFTVQGKMAIVKSFSTEIFDFTEENNAWVNENIVEPYIAQKMSENLFDI